MGFTYIAIDGNYGDASGLVFIDSDLDVSLESEAEVEEAAVEHGQNHIWITTVEDIGGEPATIGVHASEAEARTSIIENYLTGEDDEVDEDTDLVYALHMQGLTLQIASFPIPQTAF